MKKTINSSIAMVLSLVLGTLSLVIGTIAACTIFNNPQKKLIGKWKDETILNSGYEFKEDGTVKVNYVDFTIPIIGTEISGSSDGTYSVGKLDKEDIVTIKYNVLNQPIRNTYKFNISDNILVLEDISNGNKKILISEEKKENCETETQEKHSVEMPQNTENLKDV